MLFVGGQGKTQTRGVNPTLADLGQAPSSALGTHGICDFGQGCGVGNFGKAIAFFGERKVLTLGFTRDVLMSVEDDHRVERRMRAQLDDDMTPLGVHDMKGIMVDIVVGFWGRDTKATVTIALNVPYRGRCTSDEDAEDAAEVRIRRHDRFCYLLFAFLGVTENQRDVVLFRKGSNPATEVARQPHEVCVVQLIIIPEQGPPPASEPAC